MLLLPATVPKRKGKSPRWTPNPIPTPYGHAFIVDPSGVARRACYGYSEARGDYLTLAPVYINYEHRLRYPRTFELKRLEGLYT